MKKLLAIVPALLLLVVGFTNVYASDLKVGVVDLPQIVQQSPQVKKINESLKAEFASQQKGIVALQDKLRSEARQLNPQEAKNLSKADRDKIRKKVVDLQKSLQEKVIRFQQKVSKAQASAMKTFMNEVDTTVKKIAKQKDLDIVLLKPAVIYASNTVDITQQVLDALPKS